MEVLVEIFWFEEFTQIRNAKDTQNLSLNQEPTGI